MSELEEGHHEDVMRAFFRLHVGDIGRLLPYVAEITTKSAHEMGRSLEALLPEANRIVLVSGLARFFTGIGINAQRPLM